ncbi:nudix family [Seiridium cupressi]
MYAAHGVFSLSYTTQQGSHFSDTGGAYKVCFKRSRPLNHGCYTRGRNLSVSILALFRNFGNNQPQIFDNHDPDHQNFTVGLKESFDSKLVRVGYLATAKAVICSYTSAGSQTNVHDFMIYRPGHPDMIFSTFRPGKWKLLNPVTIKYSWSRSIRAIPSTLWYSSSSEAVVTRRNMTTIRLSTPDVPVALPDGLSQDSLQGFSPFKRWLERLTSSLKLQHTNALHPFHKEPYTLRSITIQSYDLFGGKRLGFLKLKADVSNDKGETLPGSVFLRGPSVAMLVILIPDDVEAGSKEEAEERHVVLTVQPRIPAGSLEFVELPAGMVDDGTFSGAAAKEIEEELDFVIKESELMCLNDLVGEQSEVTGSEGLPDAMYPSAGGCDEFIPIFMHERRVERKSLDEWTGKLTGLRDHGEKITLKLVKMKDLWKKGRRDAKCLAAVALWEGLKRDGKV